MDLGAGFGNLVLDAGDLGFNVGVSMSKDKVSGVSVNT